MTNPLCHCRKDKAGHPHEAFPRFGPWKKDPKTGKEVQELLSACPARKGVGVGVMYDTKLSASFARAMLRAARGKDSK